MKPGRVPCLVPFCRRTASREKFPDSEIICGKCWRLISRATKARRRRVQKLWNRVDARAQRELEVHGGVHVLTMRRWDRCQALNNAIWERCKKEAIEKAAGIG